MGMTRAEHLEWSKTRALELLDTGDIPQAFTSMMSDLGKHDELREHSAISLGAQLMFSGHLDTEQRMRKFIVGFN